MNWQAFITELFRPVYRHPTRKDSLLPRPYWAPFRTEVPGSHGLQTETPGEKLMREAHDYEATRAAQQPRQVARQHALHVSRTGSVEETRKRVEEING